MPYHIFSGSGAPATTPQGVGHHYIDTTNDLSYISVGTASSADWQLQAGGQPLKDIVFLIDGGGSTITTGIKGDFSVDFDATILQVTLLADQSGSIVIDLWKDTYANYPPTDADSITASATPTITTDVKSVDSTLTGWDTDISAGDTIRVNVDSVTDIQRVSLVLKVLRT